MMNRNVTIHHERAPVRRANGIRLAIFGSALREDFGPESDNAGRIRPGRTPGLDS